MIEPATRGVPDTGIHKESLLILSKLTLYLQTTETNLKIGVAYNIERKEGNTLETFNVNEKDFDDFIVNHVSEQSNENRLVQNPVQDRDKFCRYYKAILLLREFLKDGRGKATMDHPNEPWSFHSILVELDNEEFNASEIKAFTDILTLFDGMMIVGQSDGSISFSLLMEDIYTEAD